MRRRSVPLLCKRRRAGFSGLLFAALCHHLPGRWQRKQRRAPYTGRAGAALPRQPVGRFVQGLAGINFRTNTSCPGGSRAAFLFFRALCRAGPFAQAKSPQPGQHGAGGGKHRACRQPRRAVAQLQCMGARGQVNCHQFAHGFVRGHGLAVHLYRPAFLPWDADDQRAVRLRGDIPFEMRGRHLFQPANPGCMALQALCSRAKSSV